VQEKFLLFLFEIIHPGFFCIALQPFFHSQKNNAVFLFCLPRPAKQKLFAAVLLIMAACFY
jgi:hypothetical protein